MIEGKSNHLLTFHSITCRIVGWYAYENKLIFPGFWKNDFIDRQLAMSYALVRAAVKNCEIK